MRASDAERDEVAAILSEALAQGRLTSAELAERIDTAYAAKTRAELVPLTADLPADLRKNPSGPDRRGGAPAAERDVQQGDPLRHTLEWPAGTPRPRPASGR